VDVQNHKSGIQNPANVTVHSWLCASKIRSGITKSVSATVRQPNSVRPQRLGAETAADAFVQMQSHLVDVERTRNGAQKLVSVFVRTLRPVKMERFGIQTLVNADAQNRPARTKSTGLLKHANANAKLPQNVQVEKSGITKLAAAAAQLDQKPAQPLRHTMKKPAHAHAQLASKNQSVDAQNHISGTPPNANVNVHMLRPAKTERSGIQTHVSANVQHKHNCALRVDPEVLKLANVNAQLKSQKRDVQHQLFGMKTIAPVNAQLTNKCLLVDVHLDKYGPQQPANATAVQPNQQLAVPRNGIQMLVLANVIQACQSVDVRMDKSGTPTTANANVQAVPAQLHRNTAMILAHANAQKTWKRKRLTVRHQSNGTKLLAAADVQSEVQRAVPENRNLMDVPANVQIRIAVSTNTKIQTLANVNATQSATAQLHKSGALIPAAASVQRPWRNQKVAVKTARNGPQLLALADVQHQNQPALEVRSIMRINALVAVELISQLAAKINNIIGKLVSVSVRHQCQLADAQELRNGSIVSAIAFQENQRVDVQEIRDGTTKPAHVSVQMRMIRLKPQLLNHGIH